MARRPHGLHTKPATGPKPGLSDYHLRKLERLLLQGAKKHGWPNQLWTASRVARLIRERFGISYHPEHVRKILKRRLNWTSQKPQRRARERDEAAIDH
jgi:transposase